MKDAEQGKLKKKRIKIKYTMRGHSGCILMCVSSVTICAVMSTTWLPVPSDSINLEKQMVLYREKTSNQQRGPDTADPSFLFYSLSPVFILPNHMSGLSPVHTHFCWSVPLLFGDNCVSSKVLSVSLAWVWLGCCWQYHCPI